MSQRNFRIEGMSCVNCASTIEKSLKQIKGVQNATVQFTNAKAHVVYDEQLTSPNALIAVVRSVGYQALPFEESVDALRAARHKELKTYFQLFLLAAICTLPFLIEMFSHIFGYPFEFKAFWQVILATIVQFGAGWIFYRQSYYALKNLRGNMDLLVALGTTAAYGFSLVIYLWQLPQHLYFESSAVIITFILFGRWLEALTKGKTSAAIEKLLQLQPNQAWLEKEGQIEQVLAESIVPGDIVVVRPGDRVPVDGDVMEGQSWVNESMLTGESAPILKEEGSRLFTATINETGTLRVQATQVGAKTVLASIISLVEKAQSSKAPIQRLADQIASVFVPIVLLLSLMTWLGWGLWHGFDAQAIMNAIAVLVIACPCALGLATPTVIMVASGLGAQHGILFREAAALEQAVKMKVLLFDKTGTLTTGHPTVKHLHALSTYQERDILKLAASLEKHSSHPLARAIVKRAREEEVALEVVKDFEAFPGQGVSGTINQKTFYLGSLAFVHSLGLTLDASIHKLEQNGETLVILFTSQQICGYMRIADQIRASSAEVIEQLNQRHIHSIMLTGDDQATALAVAKQVGIKEVKFELLPHQKIEEVLRLKETGQTVGMIGDGINDAPALVEADVSFAVGMASDIAIEAADITLIRNDLMSVVDAVDLSRVTMRKIKQNLFLAFVYNLLAIPLAAIGLLNPMIAAGTMAMSSISVIANALLLRYWHPKRKKL